MFKKNKFIKLTSGMVLSASVPTLVSFAGEEDKDNDKVDLLMILKIAGLCLTGVGLFAYIAALMSRKSILEKLKSQVPNAKDTKDSIESLKINIENTEKEKGTLEKKLEACDARLKEVRENIKETENDIKKRVEKFVSDEKARLEGIKVDEEKGKCEKIMSFFLNEVKPQVEGLKKVKEGVSAFIKLFRKYKSPGTVSKEEVQEVFKLIDEVSMPALSSFRNAVGSGIFNNWYPWWRKKCNLSSVEEVKPFCVNLDGFGNNKTGADCFSDIFCHLDNNAPLLEKDLSKRNLSPSFTEDFLKYIDLFEEYYNKEVEFLQNKQKEYCELKEHGVEGCLKKKVDKFRANEESKTKNFYEELDQLEREYEKGTDTIREKGEGIQKSKSELEEHERYYKENYEVVNQKYKNLNKSKNFYKPWFLSENYD